MPPAQAGNWVPLYSRSQVAESTSGFSKLARPEIHIGESAEEGAVIGLSENHPFDPLAMISSDSSPNYSSPPVTEVILGVQFTEAVVDLNVLASFSLSVKDTHKKRQQQPPLPRQTLAPSGPPPPITFEIENQFPFPRTWFLNEDESEIVQVQGDRLVLNWRRMTPESAPYPSFAEISKKFAKHFFALSSAIGESGGPSVVVDFCEVTYVNQIKTDSGSPRLGDILKTVAEPDLEFLPQGTDSHFSTRFEIGPAENQQVVGSLACTCVPGLAPDGGSAFLLTLSGQVLPPSATEDGMWTAVEIGHKWVVDGFHDITTPEMHKVWGYERSNESHGE